MLQQSPSCSHFLLQVVNVTGNQDICYYNFLCAHPLGNLRWGSSWKAPPPGEWCTWGRGRGSVNACHDGEEDGAGG